MTEADARAALSGLGRARDLERWLADQPWEAVSGGWRVLHALYGWTFMVAPAGGSGVRVVAFMTAGPPATWIVD